MNKYYSSRSFQFLAIIILSSLCILLNELTRIHFSQINFSKNLPEYKASGVNAKLYNKDGKLLYQLISDNAWKYPLDDKLNLQNFTIYIYDESKPTIKYNIKALNGWFNYTTKMGYLGESTLITVPGDSNKEIKLYGSNISLDLNKNYFYSKDYTLVTQGLNSVSTIGFNYDHTRGLLNLKSNVNLNYKDGNLASGL